MLVLVAICKLCMAICECISADEELTGGSVKVSLMYGFLPIYKHTSDLCQLLQYVKKTCPLPKGIYEGAWNRTIPMDIPGVSWPKSAGREIKTIQKILVCTCSN